MASTSKNLWAGSGLFTAVLASSCCWGPAVLAGIAGASGSASFLSWIHPFSPWLKGIAILSLLIAFYQVYRKKDKGSKDAACCCDAQTVKKEKRQKVFLWTITGLVILSFFTPRIHSAMAGTGPEEEKASSTMVTDEDLEKVKLSIDGMTCIGCEKRIQDALRETDGVEKVEVSHEDGSGIVHYNPERTDEKKILERIEELGYEADLKEEE